MIQVTKGNKISSHIFGVINSDNSQQPDAEREKFSPLQFTLLILVGKMAMRHVALILSYADAERE